MSLAPSATVSALSTTHLEASKHSMNSSRAEEGHNYPLQTEGGYGAFSHKRRDNV